MSKKIHVLILDDDRLIRVAVKRILEKSSDEFIVDELAEGTTIFDILKNKKYNCLIVDYFLTNTTGIDIIKTLAKIKITIPVIMLTGQGDELVAVKALKAGAYDYLPKSILTHNDAPEILSYTIQNAVNIYNDKIEKERTAISLQKSEERYRNLVENSPMLIMRFFPDDLTISFVNDGFCDYFNTSRSDMIGESVYKFIFEENPDKIEILNSLTKENPVMNFDNYSGTKNGMRWQLWTIQALFNRLGNVLEYQCIGEDITPLKEAEKEINYQKVYFQSILDSQENIIIVTDKKEILEVNHSFLLFFGYQNLNEFKKEHTDIIDLALDIPGYISRSGEPGQSGEFHWIDSVLAGKCAEKLISLHPQWAPNAKIFSVNINLLSLEREVYVVTLSDVTELEHKSKTFEEKATIDALTGIYNKNKFYEMLSYNFDVAKRFKTNLSLIFFDIDYFKNINDTYGHQAGDSVLKELASNMKKCVRKSDVFARWGGEEFIVLLPQTDITNSLQVAEKFRKNIMNHEFLHVKELTCSFGVTKLNETDTIEKFIKRADKALYKAKESGRNRVVGIKAAEETERD